MEPASWNATGADFYTDSLQPGDLKQVVKITVDYDLNQKVEVDLNGTVSMVNEDDNHRVDNRSTTRPQGRGRARG